MNIDAFLQGVEAPWNRTAPSSIEEDFRGVREQDISFLVKLLDDMISAEDEFDVRPGAGCVPDRVTEYAPFLWADLAITMPTFHDVSLEKIASSLRDGWIEAPTPKQTEWVFRAWIGSVLSDKIDGMVIFLADYFAVHPEDEALGEALAVVEKHILGPWMKEKSGRLITLLMGAPSDRSTEILERMLAASDDEHFSETIREYIRIARQQTGNQT